MSADIDVTLSASGPPWTATVNACLGVAATTASDASPALALEGARAAAKTAILAYAVSQGTPLTPTQLASLELRLRHATGQALYLSQNPAPTVAITPSLFGEDVSTFVGLVGDLDPLFTPMTGQRVIAEAIARRLITAHGSMAYDKSFGFDLHDSIGQGFTPQQLSSMQASVESEALKDERVATAAATVTYSASSQTLAISLSLTAGAGPFSLVLTVSKLSTSLQILAAA